MMRRLGIERIGIRIIKSPVAKGSNVPACPIFFILITLRSFLTTSKEVQCKGLSINSTLPSSKEFVVFKLIMIFFYRQEFTDKIKMSYTKFHLSETELLICSRKKDSFFAWFAS